MAKNYRSYSNSCLLREYESICDHIFQSVRDKGRAPKWMFADKSLVAEELLLRMKARSEFVCACPDDADMPCHTYHEVVTCVECPFALREVIADV